MSILITGGAGFIASHLADKLATLEESVKIIDNFSTGNLEFLDFASKHAEIIDADLIHDQNLIDSKMKNVETVYHFAANADVKDGWENPRRDFQQNLLGTINLLESATKNSVTNFVFASTGSIYGEAKIFPTSEDYGGTIQTSLYGASKYSAESFIQAYASAGKINATIFRFVSILGPRYTHGHVIDFVRQLVRDPTRIKVLGDGTQRKSYLHVNDCISGVLNLRGNSNVEIFNLGTNETCTVNESLSYICNKLKVSPKIEYSGGSRGWIGDNPYIFLDTSKATSYHWVPNIKIKEAVEDTVEWLLANPKFLQ